MPDRRPAPGIAPRSVAQEDDPFVSPAQLPEAGDLRDLKIWVFWKLQKQIFDG